MEKYVVTWRVPKVCLEKNTIDYFKYEKMFYNVDSAYVLLSDLKRAADILQVELLSLDMEKVK